MDFVYRGSQDTRQQTYYQILVRQKPEIQVDEDPSFYNNAECRC